MTLQDELRVMLETARRYIKSAAVLQIEGDHDSAVSRLYTPCSPVRYKRKGDRREHKKISST